MEEGRVTFSQRGLQITCGFNGRVYPKYLPIFLELSLSCFHIQHNPCGLSSLLSEYQYPRLISVWMVFTGENYLFFFFISWVRKMEIVLRGKKKRHTVMLLFHCYWFQTFFFVMATICLLWAWNLIDEWQWKWWGCELFYINRHFLYGREMGWFILLFPCTDFL